MTTQPQGRYAQVADHLRTLILRGDIAPGTALPSESQLATQFDLSRPTVNKAIRVLVSEGLVNVAHGRGSYVRENRPVLHTSSSYVTGDDQGHRAQWHTELQRQGFTGGQRITAVGLEKPAPDIAGYLHLDDGEEVVARRRVMLLAGEPIQLATSYYPASLAAGTELAQPEKMPGGTVAALERLHLELVRFEEHISARMPTGPEAAQLNMGPGTPLLVHVRVTYAIGDLPVEVSEHVMRADQNRITYVLPAQT
jgi:GntR family transcriptional regulator